MGERYWTLGLLDAWTNPFAYVGRRTTGNAVQRTLVHGPDWKGDVPDGVSQVIAAPGSDVWIIGRVLVDDGPCRDCARTRAATPVPDHKPRRQRRGDAPGQPS